MKKVFFFPYLLTAFLSADIGHLNSIFEGTAGDIPVRVIIKTPGVVPGLADINIRIFGGDVDRVTAQPIFWKAGIEGAPPADIAEPVNGETNLYSTQLWLMNFGSYNVNIKLYENNEIYQINVPVNSLAIDIKEMDALLSVVLWMLMLLLIAGAVNIITISYRESTLHPNDIPDHSRVNKSYRVLLLSLLIVLLILKIGHSWWLDVEVLYSKNLFQPLQSEMNIVNIQETDILKVNIIDPLWQEGRNPGIIPDHGKVMHMYLISKDMAILSHIHPSRNADNPSIFEVQMPPVPNSEYFVYMDITYETGFTETIQNLFYYDNIKVVHESGTVVERDVDDSWSNNNSKYSIRWLNGSSGFSAGEEVSLHFQAIDKRGIPSYLEPYIQMGGHGALISIENNIFIHFHPIGTISMASQQVFDKQQELYSNTQKGVCYFGIPSDADIPYSEGMHTNVGRVNFPPIILDKPGEYYMWIQLKTDGEVVTEQFTFAIES